TRLEVLGSAPHDVTAPSDPALKPALESLIAFQGPTRPIKTHATVLISRDHHTIMEKLARRRVPYRMAPRTEELDLDRVWIGMTAERPHYDPAFDAGLAIEILPAEPFASAFRPPRAARE